MQNHNHKSAKEVANDSIFTIKRSEQYKTVDELIVTNQQNSVYTTLLIFSSIIIVAGLLLNNGFIVVGGMLVTPVLTPMLVIALYLSTGELGAIKNAGLGLLKSFGIVLLISIVLTIIIGAPEGGQVFFEEKPTTTFLYLLVAFASGVVATIGLIRKDIPDIFPGIAIAISMVPPLGSFGIWASAAALSPERSFDLARYFLVIFASNLVGFIVGSLIVFSVLKFHKSEKRIQEKVAEVEAAVEAKKGKSVEKAVEKAVIKAAEEVAKEVMEQVKKNGKKK